MIPLPPPMGCESFYVSGLQLDDTAVRQQERVLPDLRSEQEARLRLDPVQAVAERAPREQELAAERERQRQAQAEQERIA